MPRHNNEKIKKAMTSKERKVFQDKLNKFFIRSWKRADKRITCKRTFNQWNWKV